MVASTCCQFYINNTQQRPPLSAQAPPTVTGILQDPRRTRRAAPYPLLGFDCAMSDTADLGKLIPLAGGSTQNHRCKITPIKSQPHAAPDRTPTKRPIRDP